MYERKRPYLVAVVGRIGRTPVARAAVDRRIAAAAAVVVAVDPTGFAAAVAAAVAALAGPIGFVAVAALADRAVVELAVVPSHHLHNEKITTMTCLLLVDKHVRTEHQGERTLHNIIQILHNYCLSIGLAHTIDTSNKKVPFSAIW